MQNQHNQYREPQESAATIQSHPLYEPTPNSDAHGQEIPNPTPILNGRRLSIEQAVYHNSMANQHEAMIKQLTQNH
ncbi:hypothetical protein K7432_001789 [Basidiobolus ranarum]|uniref:Uncharacterized protein n=1 Tax=Basidiobolus ranarum TaxID=34480 RepID=A0ABR2W930_9FUNG